MRAILARTLHWVSLVSGDALRRAKAQRAPRILMYHTIGEGDVGDQLFDWQLSFLQREFDLLSLEELLRRREEGAITGREVAITFDDGVLNHVTTAYPILLRHRAPATFFVCPTLIESGRWIWNTELRCRLKVMTSADRDGLRVEIDAADSQIESLVERAKRLDLASRQRAEDWVRRRTAQFVPSPQEIDRYSPLNWQQLAGLDPALITVGSHTLSHPILPTLSPSDLREEISASRRVLEQQLGREVRLFCYPNGDNDASAQALVRDHYSAAVTTIAGAVSDADDRCLLPRIPAGETRGLFVRRLHRHTA